MLAGTADGERLVRECFGDEAAWIPYIRPGFTLSKQVGEAARRNPDLKLVVLAKHGLVVWGDTAEEAYRRTIEVDQPGGRLRQRAHRRRAALRRRAPRGRRVGDGERGGAAARAAAGDPRRGLERAAEAAHRSTRRRARSSSSPRRRPSGSSTVGAPCPDHLVHTKRVPLWIPFDPDADDADALRARIAERAEAFRADYRAYVDAHGDETTEPADPDARIVLVQHLGLVVDGHDDEDVADRARPLPPRDRGDGGRAGARRVRLARRRGELRDRVLAARALQARAGAAARRAAGPGRARHRRRGRHRPRDRRRAVRRRRLRRRLRPRRGRRRGGGRRRTATRGSRCSGDVTSEESVAGAFAAAVERFGGVDIVVSNAGVASSAALEDTSLAEWRRNHEILGHRLLPRRARGVPPAQAAGPRRLDRLHRLQERARRRQERRRVLVGQGRRAAPRALPGRGGRRGRDPRQHRQPRRGPAGLAHLGLVLARGARRGVRDRARRARGALPQAHDAAA